MNNKIKRFYDFIRAFNFCFGLMLLVFVASIFLTIYMGNLWYLLLAALDIAFFFAFYFVFMELFNYFTIVDEVEQLKYRVEDLDEILEKTVTKSINKEDEIDFFKVNQNNKL